MPDRADAPLPAGSLAERIAPCKLVIAVQDLAGYIRAAQTADEMTIAAFLDAYYALAAEHVTGAGGRVVKYLGDAVLAVFPPEHTVQAVDAMVALRERTGALARRHSLGMLGPGHTNLHLAVVAAGEYGPSSDRRYDILGAGVNHCFLLGQRQGPGVHLSEPVYRQLPSERRGPWRKQRPPAVYTLPGC